MKLKEAKYAAKMREILFQKNKTIFVGGGMPDLSEKKITQSRACWGTPDRRPGYQG